MERSEDWMDEAEGDLEHAKNDMEDGFYNWACFSSQRRRYTREEARRLIEHAERIVNFCSNLLAEV